MMRWPLIQRAATTQLRAAHLLVVTLWGRDTQLWELLQSVFKHCLVREKKILPVAIIPPPDFRRSAATQQVTTIRPMAKGRFIATLQAPTTQLVALMHSAVIQQETTTPRPVRVRFTTTS